MLSLNLTEIGVDGSDIDTLRLFRLARIQWRFHEDTTSAKPQYFVIFILLKFEDNRDIK